MSKKQFSYSLHVVPTVLKSCANFSVLYETCHY